MNTCKTCAHWGEIDAYDWNELRKIGGYCNSEKLRETSEDAYDSDALVYSYDEGGRFWTGPDFGCIHHKSKTPP